MDCLVSVVVPVYKVEQFLDKCIESIVNQTYSNLEIILVDDGSPDACPDMCDAWAEKDSRITVVHKENGGAGLARNAGIEKAAGKYICFFDSDDYVDSAFIEKCVHYAETESADIVICGFSDVDINGNSINTINARETERYNSRDAVVTELLPELISHDFRNEPVQKYVFSIWTAMFSLSLIKDNSLRFLSERDVFSEDSYFLLQYFSVVDSAVVIPDVLYFRYVNNCSLSATYNKNFHSKINCFLENSLVLINGLHYPDEIKIRLYMMYHSFVIGALKLLHLSSLDSKEIRRLTTEILSSEILRDTIQNDVLKREKKTICLFLSLARLRMFRICNLLIKLKNS